MTESKAKGSTHPLSPPNSTLQIHQPKVEIILKTPKSLLGRNDPSTKATHTYNIVDDLVRSPTTMSTVEVL